MGLRTRFAQLGQGYQALADRHIKPLLRGMDADLASKNSIEGLAFSENDITSANVRNNKDQDIPDTVTREQRRLQQETIPAGGWVSENAVSNSQPNILGRLLVSDANDEVANRLLNDSSFAKELGTTPAELQELRVRMDEGIKQGADIQQRHIDDLRAQGFDITDEGANLLRLQDEVRQGANNQSVNNLMNEMRNPRIEVANETADDFSLIPTDGAPPLPPTRTALQNPSQPQTFKEYTQLKRKQEKNLRKSLSKGGKSSAEVEAFIADNPNPYLPDLLEEEFNEFKSIGGEFDLGMSLETGVDKAREALPPRSATEQQFLADYLKDKVVITKDTLDATEASANEQLRHLGRIKKGTYEFGKEMDLDADIDLKANIWEQEAQSLSQMRGLLDDVEGVGNRANQMLGADEMRREREALNNMRGGEKVRMRDPWTGNYDSGMLDEDVIKFIRSIEDVEGSGQSPAQIRELIDLKVTELNATRPDIVELGLKHLDDRQLNQASKKTGGGRRSASKVLSKADRAGMDIPFLSDEARNTYKMFVNPNNPLNLGTPVMVVGGGALATAGALLVDAVKQEELDDYASSMAKQQASDTLRRADPEVLAMAIQNAGWY